MSQIVLRNVDDGTFRLVENGGAEFTRLIALKSSLDNKKPLFEQTSPQAAGITLDDQVYTLDLDLAATAAGADLARVIGEAPFPGRVVAVKYIPATTLTGANADSRTVSSVNKGQDGSGTTVVASLAFVAGVNAPAADEKLITLSVTPANLVVAKGDVLQVLSTHVGSTGLADPGGKVLIDIAHGIS